MIVAGAMNKEKYNDHGDERCIRITGWMYTAVTSSKTTRASVGLISSLSVAGTVIFVVYKLRVNWKTGVREGDLETEFNSVYV